MIAQTPMRRMECEYHQIARETIGTLLSAARDVDVSDYMLPISIARIDRDSHTTVGEARHVYQIVHYLCRVYRCGTSRADKEPAANTRSRGRGPAARARIARRCGDARRRCPFVFAWSDRTPVPEPA